MSENPEEFWKLYEHESHVDILGSTILPLIVG